jgi:hypothetical protein
MKKILLLVLLFCHLETLAAGGIWQSYIILNVNGSNSTYMGALGGSMSPSLNGANLGTITSPTSLQIIGSGTKTFKNSGTDVCSARLVYRVYRQGTTPTAWNTVNLPFLANLGGGGDQEWANMSINSSVPNVFVSTGIYVFEAYWNATLDNCASGGGSTTFDSNGGSNYIATFNYQGPLSVTFKDFSANSNDKKASLAWTTTEERSNSHFNIERSWDTKSFETIGSINGKGTYQGETSYQFTDAQPRIGANYYRLKQVDFDGKFSYSRIISVIVRTNGEVALFPNPTAEKLRVEGLESGSLLSVVDMQGREIYRTENGDASGVEVEVKKWPKGSYFLKINEMWGVKNIKFVVE